jgi:hypothetical protein
MVIATHPHEIALNSCHVFVTPNQYTGKEKVILMINAWAIATTQKKRRKPMNRGKAIYTFTLLAVVAAIVGLAGAQSSVFLPLLSSSDEYHACVTNSSGAIRMVSEGVICDPNEEHISWNQAGPQGPPGADAQLDHVMQANNGYVLTKVFTLPPVSGVHDVLEVPEFGPISGGCENGVSTVIFTMPEQTFRRVWTTVDGGAPIYSEGFFTTSEPVIAYGADQPGAHVSTFRATTWNGTEEWLTTIEVDTAASQVTMCSFRITVTSVRFNPGVD